MKRQAAYVPTSHEILKMHRMTQSPMPHCKEALTKCEGDCEKTVRMLANKFKSAKFNVFR